MSKVNQKKRQHVIHVSIRPTSKKSIRKEPLQNESFSSDIIHQKNNITSQNKQCLIQPRDQFKLDQKYTSQRILINSEQDRSICGSNNHIISSKQSLLSISKIKSNNKNINRVTPSLGTSSILEKQKYSISINMKSENERKRKYCGFPLWLLLLLLYFLLALMGIIAAITIGILTANKGESSSNSTSIITTTITSVTTTSSTSTTSTTTTVTTATTTSTTTSVSTTSTTTSTTTTFYTCSNFTVKANWDYNGSGGVPYTNSIGASL